MNTESDPDYDSTCQRCHHLYTLRDGDEPTPYCDHCAHERVEELESLCKVLIGDLQSCQREHEELCLSLIECITRFREWCPDKVDHPESTDLGEAVDKAKRLLERVAPELVKGKR